MDDLFSCEPEEPSVGSCSVQQSSESEANGSNHQYLMKVEPDGDGHAPLFILVTERPDLYYLEVSDGLKSWIGTYTRDSIKAVAKDAKMAVGEVAMETKRALTGIEGVPLYEYSYTTVTNSTDNTIQLTWKKQLYNNDVKVALGQVILEPCLHDDEVHARIMDFAVMEIRNLKENIMKLTETKERLTEERVAVLKRFEQCVDLKEEIEGDLYGKFKLVLNEKKAKVRGLMEALKKAKEDVVTMSTGKRSHTQTTPTNDSTDDEIVLSDDECSPPINTPVDNTQQCTNTTTLLLGDKSSEPSASGLSPPTKRRKRTKNRPTVSTIPRVLTPSGPAGNRRSSSRDSEEIPSEDLINMM